MKVRVFDSAGKELHEPRLLYILGWGELVERLRDTHPTRVANAVAHIINSRGVLHVKEGKFEGSVCDQFGLKLEVAIQYDGGEWEVVFKLPFEYTPAVEHLMARLYAISEKLEQEVKRRFSELEARIDSLEAELIERRAERRRRFEREEEEEEEEEDW